MGKALVSEREREGFNMNFKADILRRCPAVSGAKSGRSGRTLRVIVTRLVWRTARVRQGDTKRQELQEEVNPPP